MLCIEDKTWLKIKGTLYGSNMNMIEARLHPCIDPSVVDNVGSTICASYTD